MTKRRLGWLSFVLASGAMGAISCGDHDDGTTGTDGGGSGGGGGSTATGGSTGVGGASTGGTGGTGGSAGVNDAGARIPCGEGSCNPNATNRYCNPASPEGPRCQACLTDEHCANNMQNPPRLFCDTAEGSCRSCLNDGHCTPPNRCVMGNSNNTCQLRCSSDADCANATGNRRACNLTTMMCVECQNNTHCVGNASGAVCVGENCEECGVDTDCITPGLPACINNNCEGCRDNTQCAEPTPICVTRGANTCRECGVNADCTGRPGGPACVTNVCRQCSGSVPCPAGSTCTMNVCVSVPVPDAAPPVPDAAPPVPEAGPPDTGPDGFGVDVEADSGSEAGPPEAGGTDDANDTGTD